MKKNLLVLGVFILFSASNAFADFSFGVKSLSLSEIQSTGYFFLHSNQMLGCHFGIDLSPQLMVIGGLDLSHASSKEETTPGDYNPTDVWELSYTSFTPCLGVKFLFEPRSSGEIIPYLEVGIFKSFTTVSMDSPLDTPEKINYDEELYKEVLSPFGFYPAFGVEYFFSDNFSFGGEMGLRFSFASGEASVGPTTTKIKNDFWLYYIGITLNYRFGGK